MVVHEQYELFLVHSHDYEPLVHDIFIFIFTGSRVSPNSYSWVHKIFMNLFMGLQFYIHGFIGFWKKYSWIHDTKFMTSPTQIHEFIYFSWILFIRHMNIFMVMVHDYYSPNSFFKELNKRVLVLWSPFLILRTLEITHSLSPKITEKNTASTIFMKSHASDKIWFILFIVIHSHMIHIHELIHSHEFHIHTHINS